MTHTITEHRITQYLYTGIVHFITCHHQAQRAKRFLYLISLYMLYSPAVHASTLLAPPTTTGTDTKMLTLPIMGTQSVPRHLAKSQEKDGIIGSQPVPMKTQHLLDLEKPPTPRQLIAKVLPPYPFNTEKPTDFMTAVNNAKWHPDKEMDEPLMVKLQILLDWNHASPGPITSGWGMNSRKAVRAFEKMHGLKVDGQMDQKVWDLLIKGDNGKRPALVTYTITKDDVRTRFRRTPRGYAAKARDWELSYQNIYEMFGERFHMNRYFLQHLNKGKRFRTGQKITVVNVGEHNVRKVNRIFVDKRRNVLYAYNDKKMVATYPTTIGDRTPRSGRSYSIIGKVFMPTYKAETTEKRYILPPGPNSPVGVAWMALSKPTFGIHGSPDPEKISRQRSLGCVRLTNWDASELYATIQHGTWVTFR